MCTQKKKAYKMFRTILRNGSVDDFYYVFAMQRANNGNTMNAPWDSVKHSIRNISVRNLKYLAWSSVFIVSYGVSL